MGDGLACTGWRRRGEGGEIEGRRLGESKQAPTEKKQREEGNMDDRKIEMGRGGEGEISQDLRQESNESVGEAYAPKRVKRCGEAETYG